MNLFNSSFIRNPVKQINIITYQVFLKLEFYDRLGKSFLRIITQMKFYLAFKSLGTKYSVRIVRNLAYQKRIYLFAWYVNMYILIGSQRGSIQ